MSTLHGIRRAQGENGKYSASLPHLRQYGLSRTVARGHGAEQANAQRRPGIIGSSEQDYVRCVRMGDRIPRGLRAWQTINNLTAKYKRDTNGMREEIAATTI